MTEEENEPLQKVPSRKFRGAEQPGLHPAPPRSDLQVRPGGGRSGHKAPWGPGRRVLTVSPGAVGKGGQRTAPGQKRGEEGSKAATQPGPSGPRFDTSQGTTLARAHFGQRHFRQLSRNPGGLKALWSAPRAPPAPARLPRPGPSAHVLGRQDWFLGLRSGGLDAPVVSCLFQRLGP